jgi:uncharacterized glyoxalase superfamily protein PhnB
MSDSVTVSRDVAVDPARAFAVFTEDVGAWYRVDRFTVVDHRRTITLRFEPYVGGRFIDVHDASTGEGPVMGHIQVWDPPHRLQFVDSRDCEVEVTFVPVANGTRVSIEQRGLNRLPDDVADHVRRYGWHTVTTWFVQHLDPGGQMPTKTITFGGLVPYLYYDDAEAMLEWYSRVFGWEETGRWEEGGRVHNAEMRIGGGDLWLDGGGSAQLERLGQPHPVWIGVWVDDPDAMYERVRAAGVEVEPPEDKPYGVRMLTVPDPAGYHWGFMTRTST